MSNSATAFRRSARSWNRSRQRNILPEIFTILFMRITSNKMQSCLEVDASKIKSFFLAFSHCNYEVIGPFFQPYEWRNIRRKEWFFSWSKNVSERVYNIYLQYMQMRIQLTETKLRYHSFFFGPLGPQIRPFRQYICSVGGYHSLQSRCSSHPYVQ